jgi:hypothetical protein
MSHTEKVLAWIDTCIAITEAYCAEHGTNVVPADKLPPPPAKAE